MQRQFIAMKAFIIDEEKDTIFLMHKGTKDILNPGKWEIPGGKMEFGETTAETFKREVKEESGLDIEIGKTLLNPWQWTFTKSNGDEIQIIAVGRLCRALTKHVDYSKQTKTDNLIEGRWVPINEALNYDLIPNLIPTMQIFVDMYNRLKSSGISIFEKDKGEILYISDYLEESIKRL